MLLSLRRLIVSVASTDVPLVNAIDLDIDHQSCVTLVGESGSGKSLTAACIMRLLPSALSIHPDSAVTLNGTDILAQSDAQMRDIRGNRIGMIFQEPMSALNPLHTVRRQIAETLYLHNSAITKSECNDRVSELLHDVLLADALTGRGDVYPHELSGGQRQRVIIAIALANNPQLLIADEPTTALDVTTQAAVLDLLMELREKHRAGLLLITHDLKLAARYADTCYVMQHGNMVEHGKASAILSAPEHAYTTLLLESRRLLPPIPRVEPAEKAAPVVEAKTAAAGYTKRGFLRSDTSYVINDVNVNVQPGRTLGIVGGSGSGKTTFAMALLGMTPAKGELRVDNINCIAPNKKESAALKKCIHIVFQDPYGSLNPRMTVREILTEGPRAQHMRDKCTDSYAESLLDDVGLEKDHLHRYPHMFSGGQRQRIVLARALAMDPKVLILDEPTSALDVITRKHMLELLRDLQVRRNMAYVLISHDMHVVTALSDHILVLKDGKVIEYGSTADIQERPQSDYTKLLADAALL